MKLNVINIKRNEHITFYRVFYYEGRLKTLHFSTKTERQFLHSIPYNTFCFYYLTFSIYNDQINMNKCLPSALSRINSVRDIKCHHNAIHDSIRCSITSTFLID